MLEEFETVHDVLTSCWVIPAECLNELAADLGIGTNTLTGILMRYDVESA